MNKIVRKINELGVETFILYQENGTELLCEKWFEKKINDFHVKIPVKGNFTGRTYVRLNKIINDEYLFDNKLSHRENISSGGWRSRLNDIEKVRLLELENEIEGLKKLGKSRKAEKVEKDINKMSKEQLEKMILECQKKLGK